MGGKGGKIWQSEFANNLIVVSGMQSIDEAVNHLIDKKLNILQPLKPPIDLKMVASLCDIMPDFTYETMTQDARLVPLDGRFYIQVNKKLYYNVGRRNYSIAHEISHKILTVGKSLELIECDDIGNSTEDEEEEWLCDLAAKYLLLLTPEHIKPIIAQRGLTLFAVQQILTDFRVSFEAAIRALIDISSEPIAAIYCTKNKNSANFHIARFYLSSGFPIDFSVRQYISMDSCIYKCFQTGHVIETRENWQLKNQQWEFDITVVARQIYSRGLRQNGCIALLKNPVQH